MKINLDLNSISKYWLCFKKQKIDSWSIYFNQYNIENLILENLSFEEKTSIFDPHITFENGIEVKISKAGLFKMNVFKTEDLIIFFGLPCFPKNPYNNQREKKELPQIIFEQKIVSKNEKNNINNIEKKFIDLKRFASGIAHEINNPLSITVGNTKFLMRSLQNDIVNNEDMIKRLDKIKSANFRIEKIIDCLKIFSNDNQDLKEQIDINSFVKAKLEKIYPFYSQLGVKIDLRISDKNLFILGNKSYLESILINLIANARDSLEKSVKKNIDVEIEKVSSFVEVSVSDNGCGISSETKPFLFDLFYTTKKVGAGVGLGLGMVKFYVEEMMGEVTYNSSPDGTTFTVRFPLSES